MSSQVNGNGAASKTELADGAKALFDGLGAFLEQAKPPGPPPGGGHGGKGGLFSKIENFDVVCRSVRSRRIRADVPASAVLSS